MAQIILRGRRPLIAIEKPVGLSGLMFEYQLTRNRKQAQLHVAEGSVIPVEHFDAHKFVRRPLIKIDRQGLADLVVLFVSIDDSASTIAPGFSVFARADPHRAIELLAVARET